MMGQSSCFLFAGVREGASKILIDVAPSKSKRCDALNLTSGVAASSLFLKRATIDRGSTFWLNYF